MKSIFLVIMSCWSILCSAATSPPQTPFKRDTTAPLNLFKAENDVQTEYWEAAAQAIKPQVPTLDTQAFQSAFYRPMKGQFKGQESILHLHFGHLGDFQSRGAYVEWGFAGTLYVDALKKCYEIWGQWDSNRISIWGYDNTQKSGEPVWTGFATFDAQQHFKGIFFQNKDLQQGQFDFHEVPVANTGVALTFDECYARRVCGKHYNYKWEKRICFATWMHHSWQVADAKYNFLKPYLDKTKDCDPDTQTFMKKAMQEMKEALKQHEPDGSVYIRNDEYFQLRRSTIAWNQDDLLVMRQYYWDETTINLYGIGDVEFATYDLKRKRLLTSKEVFKPNYDEEAFAKAIYKHLGWEIDANHLDTNKHVSLRSNEISNGFTSKGFYLVGAGNHGYLLSDKFVAYEAVEPFLSEDFKLNYWKR